MATEDKIKWNKKYKAIPFLSQERDASAKLRSIAKNVDGKDALDVACGTGRNSIYLANLNFDVLSIDISEVALEQLKAQNLSNITTKLVDLDVYIPLKNSFDLIIISNFLDRNIIPHLCASLKKDGVLIIETFMKDSLNEKKATNESYLLQKDELKTFFDDSFTILEYDEFDNDPSELYKMRKQSIIVRKN